MIFEDRVEAGQRLGERLRERRGADVLVLGLPRGGVVVAAEVARELDAPLDVVVARKLGAPLQPELGIGAIAPGVRVLNKPIVEALAITDAELEEILARESATMLRYLQRFRGDRAAPAVEDRTAIVVDDGLATGVTAMAAVRSLRQQRPARVILAVPVGAREAVETLRREADEVVCVLEADDFGAVGSWYRSFEQISDEEVVALLERSVGRRTPPR